MSDTSLDLGSVSKLKVADLKKALKEKGLSVQGTKPQLAERLQQFLTDSGAEPEPLDTSATEDVSLDTTLDVNLEDDVIQDEKKPVVEESSEPAIKKICFDSSSPEETEGKKVVSGVSESDRLQKRADRFGTMSEDARKKARAERFGITSEVSTVKAGTDKTSSPTVQSSEELERLKKRAQRFGTTVAPALSKVEEEMRLNKRKARFGVLTSTSVNTMKTSTTTDELKMKRAERFGPVK